MSAKWKSLPPMLTTTIPTLCAAAKLWNIAACPSGRRRRRRSRCRA